MEMQIENYFPQFNSIITTLRLKGKENKLN